MKVSGHRTVSKDSRRLGLVIRGLREKAGMSVAALARATDTDDGHMCLIEQGKTGLPLPRLRRIAEALGVPAWKLLKLADEPDRAAARANTDPA